MALEGPIPHRYAQALVDLADESDLLERIASDLEKLGGLLSTAEGRVFTDVMSNPGFTALERRGLLGTLVPRLDVCPFVRNFLYILLEKHRFAWLPAILRAWNELLDNRAGRIRATVTSALALDQATAAGIQDALARVTARPVVVTTRTDATLLSGVVVQVRDTVYDASLKSRLEAMRHLLLQPVAERQAP
jgi:F-type H+-transporting ATPase subunit delta